MVARISAVALGFRFMWLTDLGLGKRFGSQAAGPVSTKNGTTERVATRTNPRSIAVANPLEFVTCSAAPGASCTFDSPSMHHSLRERKVVAETATL